MQSTIRAHAQMAGTGLHTGRPVRVLIRPAMENTGIWFRRVDVAGADPMIPARFDHVEPSRLCTRLVNAEGVGVSTVEHLMAALAGLGITNAVIDVDGPEIPILDGSAAPFVRAILRRGIKRQSAPLKVLRVLRTVEVIDGSAAARLEPASAPEIDFAIDFPDVAIGHQHRRIDLANGAFVRDLADSRTFCLQADVERMQAGGLALGGTLDNAVVFDHGRVLTPGGLRHADEPVRHKMLDALGDLALAGAPLIGRYVGWRSGHAMTNRLLRALFATPGALCLQSCEDEMAAALPGVGVVERDVALCA